MKPSFILLFFFAACFCLRAQKASANYKYRAAKAVYDRLVQARGQLNVPPTFYLSEGQRSVAAFDPDKNTITLEEKAYDICAGFGADSLNALAYLLGHELIHFYQKHRSILQFMYIEGMIDHKTAVGASVAEETEADYLGNMLAFTAGFDAFEQAPALLQTIYQEYGLQDKIQGYLPLDQRIEMAAAAKEQLIPLIRVFEAANYFLAIGEYEIALAYYRKTAAEFTSKEILNNLGVASLLEALNYFPKEEMAFVLPVELDLHSRLQEISRSPPPDDLVRRTELLTAAVQFFKDAIRLDDQYISAHVNLGCAYLLLNDFRKANYLAEEALILARRRRQTKLESDVYVLMGVLAARQNKAAEADSFLQEALKVSKTGLAKYNKAILNQTETPPAPILDFSVPGAVETIEGRDLDAFSNEIDYDETYPVSRNFNLYHKSFAQSQVMIHFENPENYALIHRADPNYKGQTKAGIKNKSPDSKLEEKYGSCPRQIQFAQGQIWVYPERKLFFLIDRAQKVRMWGAFKVRKLGP